MTRHICLLFLPAHLSQIYQSLDVDIFNGIKRIYHQTMPQHLIDAAEQARVAKLMFWEWHHTAWKDAMANKSLVRTAWKKSGLWPLNRSITCPNYDRSSTPEHQIAENEPRTPLTDHARSHNARLHCQGSLSMDKYVKQLEKARTISSAKRQMLEHENEKLKEFQRLAAKALFRGPRPRNKIRDYWHYR